MECKNSVPVVLGKHGRITIPEFMMKGLGIEEGDKLKIELQGIDIVLKPVKPTDTKPIAPAE